MKSTPYPSTGSQGEWGRPLRADAPEIALEVSAFRLRRCPIAVSEAGRRYVVLSNANGILAAYRVRPDGILKRLKRWPPELA
jgi:hypothetical protein